MKAHSQLPEGLAIDIDRASLLVDADARATLRDVEHALRQQGLTLAVPDAQLGETVGGWVGKGAPGAPTVFDDPVDHVLAGFVAHLRNGTPLEVRSSPRRAVGPDLVALVLGQRDRYAILERVSLRAHLVSAEVYAKKFAKMADPELNEGEETLFRALDEALRRPSTGDGA